jgi:hypothetical protein
VIDLDLATRKGIQFEETDIAALRQALSHYADPDSKINDMVRRGEILRLRRGLYAVAKDYRQRALSLEILANMIYGPSYISLESALSAYGIIPERVPTITSVCLGRSRSYVTPVGSFYYTSIKKKAYVEGFDCIILPDSRSYLMATREKALADLIETGRHVTLRSCKAVEQRLFEDLRMDESILNTLDIARFRHFAELFGSAKLFLAADFFEKLRKRTV